MKKYWKLVVVAIAICVVFLLFFIDVGNISKNFPTFKIKDISGNAEEIDTVRIKGEISTNNAFSGDSFEITPTKTTYNRDKLLYDFMNPYYISGEIEKLQGEHRNFMRAKYPYIENFYEDDRVLAYASGQYSVFGVVDNFTVDVLNKDTNIRNKFTLEIPNRSNIWYFNVLKVVVFEDELFLITENASPYDFDGNSSGMDQNKVVMYRIDLNEGKLIEATVVAEVENDGNFPEYREAKVIASDNPGAEEVIVQIVTTIDQFQDEVVYEDGEAYYTEGESNEYHEQVSYTEEISSYNLRTGTVKALSTEKFKDIGTMIKYEDGLGYFVNNANEQAYFTKVDIATNEVIQEGTVDLSLVFDELYVLTEATIKDGKMYVLPNNYGEGVAGYLYVIDLETFSLAYKGEVSLVQNNAKQQEQFNHYFYEVNVD